MMDKDFDDILKKRLQQYESPVPADMWERIIGKKKKRRFGFIWWQYLSILVSLVLVSGIYIHYSQQNKKISDAGIISPVAEHSRTDSFSSPTKAIEQVLSPNNNDTIAPSMANYNNTTSATHRLFHNETFVNNNQNPNREADVQQQWNDDNSNNVTHCNRIALLFNEPNNIFLPHGICLIAKKLSR